MCYVDRPPRERLLVFGAPDIQEAEIAEVVDSMRSRWLGTGPKALEFERTFAAYKQASHSVAVSSCTAALHLSLIAAGVQPGDEVITSPLTFCATANAILHAGARPVLADIDADSMNICPHAIDAAISEKTKAILPVHFAGRPCDMESIMALAQAHDLLVIEDCAHAIETEVQGRPAGTLGDMGCFSFYATKNVTTAEGGMILCRREADAQKLKRQSLHGLSHDAWRRFHDLGYKHYFVTELGFKYNMTDLQAAIGLHQLARVESNWNRRREIWNRYLEQLADTPLQLPAPVRKGDRHAYHLFTCLVQAERAGLSRDEFLVRMHRENIGLGVHYLSLPEHPYYQEQLGWRAAQWPVAERIGQQTVSLPLSPALSDDDVADVIAAVHRVLEESA
ncbi:MAG: DegT/DnrJ/EryC1/StrS family aminotransferase [Planctomycetota bacterium]